MRNKEQEEEEEEEIIESFIAKKRGPRKLKC